MIAAGGLISAAARLQAGGAAEICAQTRFFSCALSYPRGVSGNLRDEGRHE